MFCWLRRNFTAIRVFSSATAKILEASTITGALAKCYGDLANIVRENPITIGGGDSSRGMHRMGAWGHRPVRELKHRFAVLPASETPLHSRLK